MKVFNAIAFALYLYAIYNAPVYLMLVVIVCTLFLNAIHLKFIKKKEKQNNEKNKNLRNFSYFIIVIGILAVVCIGYLKRTILNMGFINTTDPYIFIGSLNMVFALISKTTYFLLIDWHFTKAVRNIVKMSNILLILSIILTLLPFFVFSIFSNNTLPIWWIYRYSYMIVWWLVIMYPFLNYSNALIEE